MKELTVTKPIQYGGKSRRKGERINASNRHANLLVALGKARIVTPDDNAPPLTRVMVAEGEHTEGQQGQKARSRVGNRRERRGNRTEDRKGQYARSDMRSDT